MSNSAIILHYLKIRVFAIFADSDDQFSRAASYGGGDRLVGAMPVEYPC